MNKGFTLIEMLVVVLIIGILAAVAYPQYRTAVAKSRMVELIVLAKKIKDSEERFYMANGKYTAHFSKLDIQMPEGGLKEGETKITYPNGNIFYLAFATQNTYASVRAFNTQKISHGYQIRLDNSSFPSQHYCLAFGADGTVPKWASAVCKNMGGLSIGSGACYSTDICPPGTAGGGGGPASFRYDFYEVD